MSRAAIALTVVTIGCHGPEHVLDVNVVADDRGVEVYVRSLDGACECSNGEFPALPGECVGMSDALECSCERPAACLEEIWIERPGYPIVGGPVSASTSGFPYSFEAAGLPDVGGWFVARGCGGEARVPLSDLSWSAVSIDSLESDGENLAVHWTSSPVGSTALLTMVRGLGGHVCRAVTSPHVFQPQGGTADWVSAKSLGGLREVETEIGRVRVWSGAGDFAD